MKGKFTQKVISLITENICVHEKFWHKLLNIWKLESSWHFNSDFLLCCYFSFLGTWAWIIGWFCSIFVFTKTCFFVITILALVSVPYHLSLETWPWPALWLDKGSQFYHNVLEKNFIEKPMSISPLLLLLFCTAVS